MKVLLAVVNCHTRAAFQQCIRETWLPLVEGADVKFFLGPSERQPKDDEVFVECDDSYEGLPSKVQALVKWALERDYDYVLKLDDDVVLRPKQFLSTGFQEHDFVGHRNDVRLFPVPFGFAYWLSKRSMRLVAEAILPADNNDEAWVTKTLAREHIVLNHEPRYIMYAGNKEDFIKPKPRALRAPVRPKGTFPEIIDPSLVVAWCMYFNWAGHRSTPDERIILEMRKVFHQHVSTR